MFNLSCDEQASDVQVGIESSSSAERTMAKIIRHEDFFVSEDSFSIFIEKESFDRDIQVFFNYKEESKALQVFFSPLDSSEKSVVILKEYQICIKSDFPEKHRIVMPDIDLANESFLESQKDFLCLRTDVMPGLFSSCRKGPFY